MYARKARAPSRLVRMHAGDCLVFLAGQVTHGAFRWNGPEHRRVCMHNYVPWQHADGGTFREPAPVRTLEAELARFDPSRVTSVVVPSHSK